MFFSKISKDEFEKRAKRFHLLSSTYLIEVFLKEKYPELYEKLHKLKSREGKFLSLPFVDLSEREEKIIFNKLDPSIKKKQVEEEFIEWQHSVLGKRLYDKPTFTINSIAGEQIIAGIGSYYSTISTSDIHYFRLVIILGDINFTSIEDLSKNDKSYIKSWTNLLKAVLVEKRFTDYHASIGMSVFTVIKDKNNKYKYIIKSNSSEKSSSAFEKHVLPSFMFQPLTSTISEQEIELDHVLNIKRETGEELLNMEELEHSPQVVTLDQLNSFIKDHPILSNTFRQVEKKECILEQTGFMFDIFRMRPELTYCLILKKSFIEEEIVTNWETGNLTFVDLNCDSSYYNLIEDQIEPLCAPGLASVINGRYHAISALEYDIVQSAR